MVTSPTRVTKSSSSIIDHLYTNRPDRIAEVLIPCYALSDHFPVCFTRHINIKGNRRQQHTSIKYRQYKNFDLNEYQSELVRSEIASIETIHDPDLALNTLLKIIQAALDKYAPIKEKRVKSVNLPGWFTDDIKLAIKERDQLKYSQNWTEYNTKRNKVTQLIKKRKAEFYNSAVKHNKSTHFLWKNIKSITSNDASLKLPTNLYHDGNLLSDTKDILNAFNDHFINVSNIVKKTQYDPSFNSKLKSSLDNKLGDKYFDVTYISTHEVKQIIDKLDINKAPGVDGISPKILKLCGDHIIAPITSILNNSISSGKFPEGLKTAYVLPIHKGSDRDDPNNYRPISILPTISKIFERHVANCLKEYLEQWQLLHIHQSGFRQHHSCQTALVRLIDSWSKDIDSGKIISTVFLDLRKAFDLVDHDFLLHQLSIYHFLESSLVLMKSYSSNHSQCVRMGNNQSSFQNVNCGVPQGSILGPLLFLIYINDIGSRLHHSSIDLYADDSTLYAAGSNIRCLQSQLQADIDVVADWCEANNMLIHPKKSKCMVIGSPNRLKSLDKLYLTIYSSRIEQVENQKVLGIYIDHNLSWKSQINYLCNKLKSKITLLSKINNYLTMDMKKLYFNAYILSNMDYCCVIWSRCNKSSISKISILQKRCAKIILRKPIRTPSLSLFREMEWLSFENRCKYHTAILVHKCLQGHTPSYLQAIVHFANNKSYTLRSTTNKDISHVKTNTKFGTKSFSYAAMEIWNAIPIYVRNIVSLSGFKQTYRNYLMLNQC